MSGGDLTFSVRVNVNRRSLVSIDGYTIRRGGITFLFGESGIGKSMINRTIYGFLPPDDFAFEVNGVSGGDYLSAPSTQEMQRRGFFVFQEPSTHLHPLLTIGEQLREGALAGDSHDTAILAELWAGTLSSTPDALLDIYPQPFRPSGGEKQRILLAMAFKKIDQWIAAEGEADPPVFVFDEPTGSLDNRFRDIVLDMLFKRFRTKPFTAVVISHDYSMVSMIRQKHADLAASIYYKELGLRQGRLELSPFEPETYLRWLRAQTLPKPNASDAGVIGTVDPSVTVFGRNLRISRDRDGGSPSPLVLRRGSMVYLKAPSGMGKTTLVKVMMGLVRAERFRMEFNTLVVTEQFTEEFWRRRIWGRSMTMVFQHADEALNPQSTVAGSFHGLPLPFSHSRSAVSGFLGHLFSEDVIREIFKKKVSRLSGGQKQRLNLLRGLALQTDLLILDEPLNGLDFESSVRVLEMLRRRLEEGSAILVISHNEEIFDSQVHPEDVYVLREDGSLADPMRRDGREG